jgi:IS30 family transposase
MAVKHLTPAEREELSRLLWAGVAKSRAAKLLGRDSTTITRELKRNSVTHRFSSRREYCPISAQQLCEERRHKPRTKKMQRPEVREYVEDRLEQRWSPDQISHRMKLDFASNPQQRISPQTIYTWIDEHDHPRRWRQCLRRYRVRKCRKNKDRGAAAIANRPEVIERRERIGDWEGDTIVGAGRSGGIVSLVERQTGYAIFAKVDNLQAATVNKPILHRLKRLPASQRRSLTFDNGREFAGHEQLAAALQVDVYFAEPHCPWQRGTNENTNGLVRQFLPKGTDFRDLSHGLLSQNQTIFNERPRKRLGYRTPQEALHAPLAVQC